MNKELSFKQSSVDRQERVEFTPIEGGEDDGGRGGGGKKGGGGGGKMKKTEDAGAAAGEGQKRQNEILYYKWIKWANFTGR